MSETADKPKTRDAGVGFDDFLEDIFGLNVKGLKSIGTLFWNPKRYYEAARDPQWEGGAYTPSFRLWIFLIAIMYFFQFFWGAESSSMMQSLALQAEQMLAMDGMEEIRDRATVEEVAAIIGKWYFASYPVIAVVVLLILGALTNFWGRKTTLAIRERYYFATIVPATAFSLLTLIATVWVPVEYLLYMSALILLTDAVIYALTLYRGAFAGLPVGGRIWRTIVVMLIIMMAEILVLLIAQMFAGVMVAATFLS